MGDNHLASLPVVRKLFSLSTGENTYARHQDEDDGEDIEGDEEEAQHANNT